MSTTDEPLPTVMIWQRLPAEGHNVFGAVGEVDDYDSLDFEPRDLDPGTWELVMPYNDQALEVSTDRYYTVDWRRRRTTWVLDNLQVAMQVTDDGAAAGPFLTASGLGALSLIGREEAWPNPSAGLVLGAQPEHGIYVAQPAESLIRTLVAENYVGRRGDPMHLPATQGRGGTVRARTRFDDLLELVITKARRGGLNLDVGLVNTSDTRARLQLLISEPNDLSGQVYLSEKVGTLEGWSHSATAPTATMVIVGGAGTGANRVFHRVTSAKGNAAAAAWGGHRVVFVDGPDSYDVPELEEAGQEVLDTGAGTNNVALEVAESDDLRAFVDFNEGDIGTGELSTGLTVVDKISSLHVHVDEAGYEITAAFGDPSEADDEGDDDGQDLALAETIKALRRRVRSLETRR